MINVQSFLQKKLTNLFVKNEFGKEYSCGNFHVTTFYRNETNLCIDVRQIYDMFFVKKTLSTFMFTGIVVLDTSKVSRPYFGLDVEVEATEITEKVCDYVYMGLLQNLSKECRQLGLQLVEQN